MQLSDTFAVSQDVVDRELGGEVVLLDLSSGLYFGLGSVGARVWEMLSQKPRTLRELADDLEREFDAPIERIEADLLELAQALRERELIIESPG